MANVLLKWDKRPAEEGVTAYNVYVGKTADTLTYFTSVLATDLPGATSESLILYPDQMGFKPLETLYASITAVNSSGDSPIAPPSSIVLPEAPRGLPGMVTNITLTII